MIRHTALLIAIASMLFSAACADAGPGASKASKASKTVTKAPANKPDEKPAKTPQKADVKAADDAAKRPTDDDQLVIRKGKKIPIADLVAACKRELAKMEDIWVHDHDTGKLLGQLNAAFQKRGYFSRIPSRPGLRALESNLKVHASTHALILDDFKKRIPTVDDSPIAAQLEPGQKWDVDADELFVRIQLELHLQGPIAGITKFIDELPSAVERLIIVTGDRSRPGGVILTADVFYERGLPMPEIALPWPELDERLAAAGHDPDDEALRKDPKVIQLREMVNIGRQRLADVKNTLAVASDFPRWLVRAQFFEKQSVAASSISGAEMLGSIAGQ